MKKYRLKKDTPSVKSGTIWEDTIHENNEWIMHTDEDGNEAGLLKSKIKNFSDWFEEIQEPKWTDEDMKAFGDWFCDGNHRYNQTQTSEAFDHWKSNRNAKS